MRFEVEDPHLALSPKTGMGRQHWLAAAKFLLEGVLGHVRDMESPIVMPGEPADTLNLEALARTFMLAAPVIAHEPDAVVANLPLRDYYAGQLAAALDPQSPRFIGHFADVVKARKREVSGHTVEGAAITVGLWEAGDAVWEHFPSDQRQRIAAFLLDVAHQRTNTHNWRWFNVLMGGFLASKGYAVDDAIMLDHLQNLMAYYAGDGWYRDGTYFDFYSAWAFQFYGPIWCRLRGYRHFPEVAAIVERRHLELQRTYPLMFGRDGRSPMWGRSAIYRCGTGAPLSAAFLLNRHELDPGWARRIASGNLLQFIGREDVFEDGVPTLGFYRAFPPVVQGYSRRASSYWLAKTFVALALPPESPFWTATENDGAWETLDRSGRGATTVVLNGPGMVLTAHGPTSVSELRTGKVPTTKSDLLYTRLVYNTAFPGEADNPHGATTGAYAVRALATSAPFAPSVNLRYGGVRGDVLYRQADLPGWMARADLAEIVVPGGVLRIDRVCIPYAYELRLGHFALPGHVQPTPLTIAGQTALQAQAADGRALAVLPLHGWDGIQAESHTDLNPESPRSTVLAAVRRRDRDHSGVALLITLLLHRTDGQLWAPDALNLIRDLRMTPWSPSGSPCHVELILADGRPFSIDFGALAGQVAT